MRLVQFTTDDNPVLINPDYVVSVRKGMKDTAIATVATIYTVKESVDLAVRLLGAEELQRDITPSLTPPGPPKSIDL
jgi:hypothetical protein